MPINEETKEALLKALDNDIDEFIRLAETRPIIAEPDKSEPQRAEQVTK